jgi:predicted aldo/keto reductase-like oxidoreductase
MHLLTDLGRFQQLLALGLADFITKSRENGKIRQIGFSFHGIKEEFLQLIEAFDWDFCQIQYNWSNENHQAGVEGLRVAHTKGLPVIIMEPLLGGRLATGLPEGAAKVFRQAAPDKTFAAWGFDWLFDQREVTVVLSGMNESAQLEENLRLAEAALPGMVTAAEKEVYARAVEAFRVGFKIPCTGCAYCMPCPQGVNIPGCFNLYNNLFANPRSRRLSRRLNDYSRDCAAFAVKPAFASNCVRCGKCETHCPQRLPIRAELDKVKKAFEPAWYRAGIKVVRRLLRVG